MSSPRRLHHAALPAEGGVLELPPAAARHARVLRLQVGDPLILFDGRGNEATAVIVAFDETRVVCQADPGQRASARRPKIVLVQCVPKGAKLDDIVRGATEIGVTAIHLALSRRCVARPEGDRATKRVDRLSKVAREAARQSGRADVPDVIVPAPLFEVAARAPRDVLRVAFVVGADDSIAGGLAGADADLDEAWIVVGPEGGLADEEARALAAEGWTLSGLGPTTLRVETAALVATALTSAALGGMR